MRHALPPALALAFAISGCSSSSGSPAAPGDDASNGSMQDGGDGGALIAEGGSSGSDAGEGGSSGSEAGSTPWAGTIGSGSVACYNDFDSGCPAHTACCDDNDPSAVKCVSSYGACTDCANGNCPIAGCDGPEDCPGQACCALVDTMQFLELTGCKASCDAVAGEYVVCKSNTDCPAQTTCHDIFGNGYMLQECGP